MDPQDIEKIINLRFEYFNTVLGIAMIIGDIYLYIHYCMDKNPKDVIIEVSIVGILMIGFLFFLFGYNGMVISSIKRGKLEEIEYKIDIIKKERKLQYLKKKFNIPDSIPLLFVKNR